MTLQLNTFYETVSWCKECNARQLHHDIYREEIKSEFVTEFIGESVCTICKKTSISKVIPYVADKYYTEVEA